jgi:hypothetical protein
MKTPKIFIGALVFYCAAVFVIGITNAADATSGNSNRFFLHRIPDFQTAICHTL